MIDLSHLPQAVASIGLIGLALLLLAARAPAILEAVANILKAIAELIRAWKGR